MVFDQIDQLKRTYTDKYVVVDERRPELARFKGFTGQIKTVNMSGRALVEFDAYANIGWFDIELDYLKLVDKPPPKPAGGHEKPAKAEAPAKPKAPTPAGEKKLSPLEAARAQGPAKKPGEGAKKSTSDILAAARGGAAAPSAAKPPASGEKKPSTAEILAAARGPKTGAPIAKAAEPAVPAPSKPATAKPAAASAAPKAKLSTSDVLAAARKNAPAAASPAAAPAQTQAKEPSPPRAEAPAPAAEEPPPPAPTAQPAKAVPAGNLPKTTPDIIAWCRQRDAK